MPSTPAFLHSCNSKHSVSSLSPLDLSSLKPKTFLICLILLCYVVPSISSALVVLVFFILSSALRIYALPGLSSSSPASQQDWSLETPSSPFFESRLSFILFESLFECRGFCIYLLVARGVPTLDPLNMTQLFTSNPSPMANEKRGNFPGLPLPSRKHSGESSHLPTRIKNFFRINSSNSQSSSHGNSPSGQDREREKDGHSSSAKNELKATFRQSRFLPTIGRNRSTTVASEGNRLEDGVSPTATANPYFAHQGPPALRHRNDGSVPSSPPDSPELQVDGVSAVEQATTANKEELARKLRRVASAPNAQGLFTSGQGDGRPRTANMGKEPLVEQPGANAKVGLADASSDTDTLSVPGFGTDINGTSFRRTYSSNSIKVRNVEVGPASFDKIKLIGKGDVGKVYLVREKKSSRLYAMKGEFPL